MPTTKRPAGGTATDHRVIRRRSAFTGAVVTVRVDTVRMPDGSQADREVVSHADSVAVVALDEHGRVLLIRQYRHPVGTDLWELPAGLCDQDGESAEAAARRELAEETGLRADSWTELVQMYPSPGMSDERVTIFLATGLTAGERPADPGGEEKDLTQRWLGLDSACTEVSTGSITNGLAVAGLLAAARAR